MLDGRRIEARAGDDGADRGSEGADEGKAVEAPQLPRAVKNRNHRAIRNDKRPQREF
jgi:hypothetical protein